MKLKLFALFISIYSCISVFAQESTIDISKNLGLTGVKNARDFGGYRVGVGKKIREHQLLRSADLSNATDQDIAILEDTFKIAEVFDFRTTKEMFAAPDIQPNNCLYISLPCLEDEVSSTEEYIGISVENINSSDLSALSETLLDSISNRRVKNLANYLYPLIIRTRVIQEQYEEFLDSITVLPKDQATLIHCTHGKDRTAWAVTYLLAALGADRATLVKEFMKCNDYYKPIIDEFVEKAKKKGCNNTQIEYLKALIGVSEKNVEDALDMIDKRYGSMEQYLTDVLKCDEGQRQKLRDRFLIDI